MLTRASRIEPEAYGSCRTAQPARERLVADGADREHGPGAVGAAAQRPEHGARRAGTTRDPLDAVDASASLDARRRRERALRRDEEAHAARRRPARPAGALVTSITVFAERRGEREPVQVDAERGPAQLRVVPAAEPRGDLDHLAARPARAGPACTSARRATPERLRPRRPRDREHRSAASARAGPDVRERDAERGRLGRQRGR